MFPIVLDMTQVRIALAGSGELAEKRLAQLQTAGAAHLTHYAADALPGDHDIRAHQIVYIVDVPQDEAEALAARCRALGVLVNVEDNIPYCDFHTPSQVRRGDLLLSISTAGKSPALSVMMRKKLESLFGPEWGVRLECLADARCRWREDGLDMPSVFRKTRDMITRKGWMT